MIRDILPWRKKDESVARHQSRDPFYDLQHRINEMFDGMLDGFGRSSDDAPGISPKFDVTETAKEYKVTAELPGMDKRDVEVTLDNNVLRIRGEKKEEREEDREGVHISERRYGSFQRAFSLPDTAEGEKIKADFKKGVLTLCIPKSETAKAQVKRVEISG
jgi:HSP20 family protein